MAISICRSEVCDREAWRVGLCATHYSRHRRGGDIDTPIRIKRNVVGVLERSEEGQKLCTKCARWKAPEHYNTNKAKADGLNPYCKACHRLDRLRLTYGISASQYHALVEKQGNACAICKISAEDFGNEWAVDHDHTCCPGEKACGECVRGLLCRNCNIAIGFLKDNTEALRNAITYLESF